MHKTMIKGYNAAAGPSPGIWANCPWNEALLDPTVGFGVYEDFVNFASPSTNFSVAHLCKGWTAYTSDGGNIADAKLLGGAMTFSSDAANEGAAICMDQHPFQISKLLGALWFEASFQVSSILDDYFGLFVGLMDEQTLSVTVPIAAAGTLADANFVGFHRLEGDGDYLDTVYRANGIAQVTVKSDAVLLAANVNKKVGFRFDPDNDYKLTFYADGVALPDTKVIPNATGTDFPADVRMGLVFALLEHTNLGSATLNWIRCFQRRV